MVRFFHKVLLPWGKVPSLLQGNQWRGTRLADNKPKGILTALINAAICIISLLQTNGCHKFVAENIKSLMLFYIRLYIQSLVQR